MLSTDNRESDDALARDHDSRRALSTPRYSRRLAKRVRDMKDGDVARFQVGDVCFMLMRFGSELFIRSFGSGPPPLVNEVPVKGLVHISLDDQIGVGERRLLMRRPTSAGELSVMQSVDRLLSGVEKGAPDIEVSTPWRSGSSK